MEAIVSFNCFLQHVQFWKMGEYHSEIPKLGYILLSDVFRPIISKEKNEELKHTICKAYFGSNASSAYML